MVSFGLARTREVLWLRKDGDTWSPMASLKARALAPGDVLVMPVTWRAARRLDWYWEALLGDWII
jgi:hypothetical protein